MLLAGDIGGTKTDLALFDPETGPRAPRAPRRFPSREYPSLEAIAMEYLSELGLPVTGACFAVAGPVTGGRAMLTNLPWVVEESALCSRLGVEYARLLNDVEAMATAVPHLGGADLHTLHEGEPVTDGALAVIAPGTGLGEAFLTWDGTRYRAHPSEGSHVDFGPTTPLEVELLRHLQALHGRVSYERVCAGRAMPELYEFLREQGKAVESAAVREALAAVEDWTPPIMAAAFARPDPDPLCLATVDLFSSVLGAAAGNLALTVLATGGVYLGGGIAQRILPVATGQGRRFLSAFHQKGRLSPLLARLPVHVIVESVALLGAALAGFDRAAASPPERP
jgi:glucokinase